MWVRENPKNILTINITRVNHILECILLQRYCKLTEKPMRAVVDEVKARMSAWVAQILMRIQCPKKPKRSSAKFVHIGWLPIFFFKFPQIYLTLFHKMLAIDFKLQIVIFLKFIVFFYLFIILFRIRVYKFNKKNQYWWKLLKVDILITSI